MVNLNGNLLSPDGNPVRIRMSGSRKGDWKQFQKLNNLTKAELTEIQKLYTLHHMNDFDPETLSCTVQLVRKDAHDKALVEGIAHEGAVSDYKKIYWQQ